MYHAYSHSSLIGRCADFLRDLGGAEALILAPERAAADELARSAGDLGGVHRLTPAAAALRFAAVPLAARGLAPVTGIAIDALAARIAHTTRRERPLDYFEPVATAPGFARALAATLTELRLEEIRGVSGDLARLLKQYEAELASRGFADLAGIFDAAASAPIDPYPLVLLNLRLQSAAERRFITALARRAPAVIATALTGDAEAIGQLEQILGVAAEPLGPPQNTTVAAVRRNLFSTRLEPPPPPDDSFEFFSTAGEGLECVEIARRIRRLEVPFDRVAILLRSPERYQPMIEEALRRAGIPAYFSHGVARPDPAGRAFLALLHCAAERCTATRFAEYLSLGQTPRESDEAAPFAWEKLLVDAAVIGGAERWQRRLRGLGTEFRLKAESDGEHAEYFIRQAGQVARLEAFALPLIDFLAGLPARAPWGEWLEQLHRLADLGLRDPESVHITLDELQPMDEVGPVDLDEVCGVLADRLRFLRREPPPRRYGRVFVGSIAEASGRSFDAVFLPGLAEGLFPRRAFEDPLLLDAARRQIAGSLATQEVRVARERVLLRIAAAAGSRLIVSYPRVDTSQSRARVPSFYAMEAVRAAEGRLPDLRSFEKRAAEAADSRLGWPAPVRVEDAIDPAEFDLAMIDRSMRNGNPRCSMRYVIDANPHLARSLRARWKRGDRTWSKYDGLHFPGGLEQYRLAAADYSPSALQHFAACPYRFFLHAIHRLRPREQKVAIEQMDPLTRGSLFHAAQYEIFRALKGGGNLLEIVDRALDKVAAKFEEDLAPAISRVWKTEIEDIRIDLRGWARQFDPEWQPYRYEFSFGLPNTEGRDPRSQTAEVRILDGKRLRGSIDLVEKHRARGVARITDHKTGKPPDPAPAQIGGGAHLQPLLYALAAEKLLAEPVESGRLYYCTQRGAYQEIEIPLDERSRQRIAYALDIVDGEIARGFLPAAPQPGACSRCDYHAVCGPHEERRVRRKPSEPLEPLLTLRNMP